MMKHPVLRVRKDAPQYDDARQDELTAKSAREDEVEPPRRRRPRARMIFLPLLVVFLGLALVLQLIPAHDTARFAAWDVRLRAEPYGDELLLSILFAAHAGARDGAAPTATVHVLLPDTGSSVDLSGTLTSSPTTLRGQLPYTTDVRRVQATITIDGEQRSLALTVAVPR